MHHVALRLQRGRGGEGYTQHWASIDGNNWVPIDRKPTDEDTDNDLRAIIEQQSHGSRFQPAKFPSEYLSFMVNEQGCELVEGSLTGTAA